MLCRGLRLARFRGRESPGGDSLSFASPKESKQRKSDPAVCVPYAALRGNLRCSVQTGSRANSPAAQTSTIPDPSGLALLGADRRVGSECGYQQPNSQQPKTRNAGESTYACTTKDTLNLIAACVDTTCVIGTFYVKPGSPNSFATRPGWACAVSPKRDQGRALFERNAVERVCADPRFGLTAQVARSAAQGPRLRVAFSLVTFFWRSKRKLLAAGRLPAPNRRPSPAARKAPEK